MTSMTLFSTSLHGSMIRSRSLLFALITPGSFKGASSIKKTLIASRFPLHQYFSFRFHSRACFFFVLGWFSNNIFGMDISYVGIFSHSYERKLTWDEANICYPTTKIGCPPSPANCTSAGYVETHPIPNLNIFKWCSITLEVSSYLSHKYTLTSVQTVAACSISRDCRFAWRHQPCPSRRGGS